MNLPIVDGNGRLYGNADSERKAARAVARYILNHGKPKRARAADVNALADEHEHQVAAVDMYGQLVWYVPIS
jgi:hypothetical protein